MGNVLNNCISKNANVPKTYCEETNKKSRVDSHTNTKSNELFLPELGIKISKNSVQTRHDLGYDLEDYEKYSKQIYSSQDELCNYDEEKKDCNIDKVSEIKIFKHFDFSDVDVKKQKICENIPDDIFISVYSINVMEDQIVELKKRIEIEKNKIANSDYVKAKLDMYELDECIKNIKNSPMYGH